MALDTQCSKKNTYTILGLSLSAQGTEWALAIDQHDGSKSLGLLRARTHPFAASAICPHPLVSLRGAQLLSWAKAPSRETVNRSRAAPGTWSLACHLLCTSIMKHEGQGHCSSSRLLPVLNHLEIPFARAVAGVSLPRRALRYTVG